MAAIPIIGPVTYVGLSRIVHLTHHPDTPNYWDSDEEGVLWLRGHHASDSPEVHAAQVALTLSEDA